MNKSLENFSCWGARNSETFVTETQLLRTMLNKPWTLSGLVQARSKQPEYWAPALSLPASGGLRSRCEKLSWFWCQCVGMCCAGTEEGVCVCVWWGKLQRSSYLVPSVFYIPTITKTKQRLSFRVWVVTLLAAAGGLWVLLCSWFLFQGMGISGCETVAPPESLPAFYRLSTYSAKLSGHWSARVLKQTKPEWKK